MKILLTGADGLLGSNLTRSLLSKGYIVRVLLLKSSKSKTLDGLNIERFYGDILFPETIDEAVIGCDALIHAAAMTNLWPPRSELLRRVNIEGTKNVIESVLKNKIARMIYIGSGSSFNANDKNGNNNSFPGKKFGLDYIDSKYEALKLVLQAVDTRGLPALSILPTFMIGPYDSLPSSGQMIIAVAKGKMKFYTGGGRNFISVKDVSEAVANSLFSGKIGRYYIACNENLTYREFLKKVALIIEKPEPRIRIPDWLVKSIGYIGTITGNIFKIQPLLSFPMAYISCEKQYSCSDDIVTDLQMPKTNIDIAIRECYEWFVENNYINSQK